MVKFWEGENAAWTVAFERGEPLRAALGESGRSLTVGVGRREETNGELVRRAAAKAVSTLAGLGARSAVTDVSEVVDALGEDGLRAVIQGAELALYRPESWKKEREERPFTLYLKGAGDRSAVLEETERVARAVCFARDLTNCPGNLLTPADLAGRVGDAAREAGLEVRIVGEDEARALGMGAFLAVGTSSGNAPNMIVLRWRGGGEEAPVALVGKAVCFDTGGYNLKPKDSINHQFTDMAGGAAVAGAMLAVARSRLKLNVTALIPAVENRISTVSLLPGDVVTSMSGRTIEIGSSDAEGRLILADAMTYAVQKEGASKIVDIATLTGATARALGWICTGVCGNDGPLYAALVSAGERWGERYWRYPDFPEYRKLCESGVADLYNSTRDGCGAIAAGMFLEHFAEGLPWIHLDIAGSAWSPKSNREYQPKGATGVGTAALYELCKNLSHQ